MQLAAATTFRMVCGEATASPEKIRSGRYQVNYGSRAFALGSTNTSVETFRANDKYLVGKKQHQFISNDEVVNDRSHRAFDWRRMITNFLKELRKCNLVISSLTSETAPGHLGWD
jgi:hypothetical protein